MEEKRQYAPGSSRRIGGAPVGAGVTAYRPAPTRAWVLKVASIAFVWPLVLALTRGSFRDAAALIVAMALLYLGSRFVARGAEGEAANEGRTLTVSPAPWKLMGAIATGVAAFLVSLGPAHDNIAMAMLFGVIAGAGCVLAYGLDPRVDRAAIEAAAKRAGIRGKDVVEALDVAYRKVTEIEESARGLHSRELRGRLERICTQARTILGQLEKDPKDLSRARRFLVTYLDGTRDVVGAYAKQQQDLADTPLAANFKQVLDTVEQVFKEQEEVLRKDDKLDLEVRIEVLETQLKREGIH